MVDEQSRLTIIEEKYCFESLVEGSSYRKVFHITEKYMEIFLEQFSDRSPIHSSSDFAKEHGYLDAVVHGAAYHGFLANFTGMHFPGPNSMTLSVDLRYLAPSYLNDQLEICGTIRQKSESSRAVILEVKINCLNRNILVASGRIMSRMLK